MNVDAPPFLFFTDLDGTLLDHHDYSPAAALPAVRRLVARGVPLIFCSSKTPAEQVFLQREIGIREPFIFENGSGMAFPREHFLAEKLAGAERFDDFLLKIFARQTAPEIAVFLKKVTSRTGIALPTFADLSPEEMRRVTNLPEAAHRRAIARRATLTIARALSADEVSTLGPLLRRRGLRLSQGGRFHTVTDLHVDKGMAVRGLTELFQACFQTKIITVAVGDSPNDAPMLRAVDLPFLLKNAAGAWAETDVPGLRYIATSGGAGFCEAVENAFIVR